MSSIKARTVLVIPLAWLSTCGPMATSKENEDWQFATSISALGKTPEYLQERLGKPIVNNINELDRMGDITFIIGKCQVSFVTVNKIVSRVSIKIESSCQPVLDGIPIIKGLNFEPGITFSMMPPDLTGTWRSSCIGSICTNRSTDIEFIHSQGPEDGALQIALMSVNDTRGEIVARDAWATSIIGRANVYSAEMDLRTICGTANQATATRILRDLSLDFVNFGYGLDSAKEAGCRQKPNPPVRSPDRTPQ